MDFEFVVIVRTKNAGPIADMSYDEAATFLFEMINRVIPWHDWMLELEVYDRKQVEKG